MSGACGICRRVEGAHVGLLHRFVTGVEERRGRRAAFAARYDALQADAVATGVCPKVMQGSCYNNHRACGRPLVEGSRFCALHRYGL